MAGAKLTGNFAWDEDRVTVFLRKVPLFRELSEIDIRQISHALELKHYPPNAVIYRQGDPGDSINGGGLNILLDGEAFVKVSAGAFLERGDSVRLRKPCKIGKATYEQDSIAVVEHFDVTRRFPFTVRMKASGERGRVLPDEIAPAKHTVKASDKVIASCRAGDYFGDQSLLFHSYRFATLVTGPQQPVVLATLTKKRFLDLELNTKMHFRKRKAVIAPTDPKLVNGTIGSGAEVSSLLPKVPKSDAEKKLIAKALQNNARLHAMLGASGGLSIEQCEQLAEYATVKLLKTGETLVQEHDPFVEEMFVVDTESEFSFSVTKIISSAEDRVSQFSWMQECVSGGVFNELHALHGYPAYCSVQATKPSKVYAISRHMVRYVLRRTYAEKVSELMKVLHHVPQLDALYHEEKETLARSMYERNYLKGEHILTAGQVNDTFFVLLAGAIVVAGAVVDRPGTYFGEQSLIQTGTVKDTIAAHSQDVVVACLSKHDFEMLLAPLVDIMTVSDQVDRPTALLPMPVKKDVKRKGEGDLKRTDLKKLALLGCGAFGAVTLEQSAKDDTVYAMKQLNKGYIVRQKLERAVMNEKRLLFLCDSPFVIKIFATFNTEQSLWMLLEPCLGGDLYSQYHRFRLHGSSERALFYAASLVYAIEHLHNRRILHRDVKPENVLLTATGRCKLADFGLAKQTNVKTYTTCGTPAYLAPEVLAGLGHHYHVDWWCLGCLIHELFAGHPPFDDGDPVRLYQKINRGIQYGKFPYRNEHQEAKDLVVELLQANPYDRLPVKAPNGWDNLHGHAWFRGFDWQAHREGVDKPPFLPMVRNAVDVSNFKTREADIPPQLLYQREGGKGGEEKAWDADFATNNA